MGPFGWIPGAGKNAVGTVTVAPATVNMVVNLTTADSPQMAEAVAQQLRPKVRQMIEEAFEPAFERAIADGGLE
jgi:hypothetical protein